MAPDTGKSLPGAWHLALFMGLPDYGAPPSGAVGAIPSCF
jgi:hypothetical protein